MDTEVVRESGWLFRAFRRAKNLGENAALGERLLDVNDASAMLGLKPATLYQWAYERKIPVVKLFGRALRFKLSVIEKLIVDSERPALCPANARGAEWQRPE